MQSQWLYLCFGEQGVYANLDRRFLHPENPLQDGGRIPEVVIAL